MPIGAALVALPPIAPRRVLESAGGLLFSPIELLNIADYDAVLKLSRRGARPLYGQTAPPATDKD